MCHTTITAMGWCARSGIITMNQKMKIKKPFRWWKTFGILSIFTLPTALIVIMTDSDAAFRGSQMNGPTMLGSVIGLGGAAALVITLWICTAQIIALHLYYLTNGSVGW